MPRWILWSVPASVMNNVPATHVTKPLVTARSCIDTMVHLVFDAEVVGFVKRIGRCIDVLRRQIVDEERVASERIGRDGCDRTGPAR